jgi:hypothetical protein
MYMYDETTGKKGSNESVSLLKHYIDKYMWRSEDPASFTATTMQDKIKTFWWPSF